MSHTRASISVYYTHQLHTYGHKTQKTIADKIYYVTIDIYVGSHYIHPSIQQIFNLFEEVAPDIQNYFNCIISLSLISITMKLKLITYAQNHI
jgi:hypothetical protein